MLYIYVLTYPIIEEAIFQQYYWMAVGILTKIGKRTENVQSAISFNAEWDIISSFNAQCTRKSIGKVLKKCPYQVNSQSQADLI